MFRLATAAAVLALAGCSTTQNVQLAQLTAPQNLSTAALVPSPDNSPDMDNAMRTALMSNGVQPLPSLPAGTLKSKDTALLVTYNDTWHWDIVMYLRLLTVSIYDANTGSMLAVGNWKNSPAHQFPSYTAVVNGLVGEMLAKIKALPKADAPAALAPSAAAASAAL